MKVGNKTLADDPVLRHRFADFAVQIEVQRLICWRIVAVQMRGEVPTLEGNLSGLIGKLRHPRLAELAADVLGRYGALPQDEALAPVHGRLQRLIVRGILTHPGGTPEILKNVVAIRALGLPRS